MFANISLQVMTFFFQKAKIFFFYLLLTCDLLKTVINCNHIILNYKTLKTNKFKELFFILRGKQFFKLLFMFDVITRTITTYNNKFSFQFLFSYVSKHNLFTKIRLIISECSLFFYINK